MNNQKTINNISDKFTNHYKRTISRAIIIAAQNKRKQVDPVDLFWAIYQEKGSLAAEVLSKAKIKITDIQNQVKEVDIVPSQFSEKEISIFSEAVKKIIQESVKIAVGKQHRYVGTEHLLMAILSKSKSLIDDIFLKQKVNPDDILKMVDYLGIILDSTSKFPELNDALQFMRQELEGMSFGDIEESKTKTKSKAYKTPALNLFGINLTDLKVQNRIDPVIGRSSEIARVIQILGRRTKNNPVLLGDAGVGKTAIVEGLAKKIIQNDVPDILLNKKIYALDINQLVAGTMFRGDFENRIQHVLEEVRSNPDIILFIDEIHNIIGAGSGQGTMDAANILKPFLARGEIRCIGATTFDEYKKYIERDPALDRRFQPVQADEPSKKDSIEILKGIKENYEKHHLVNITNDALESAVELSSRYITEKFLPDKAIDLIDEAASKLKIKASKDPNLLKLKKLENEYIELQNKKHEMVLAEKLEEALVYKQKEEVSLEKIIQLQEKIANTKPGSLGTIAKKDIAEIVSSIVKIPLGELLDEEKKKLVNLEKELSKNIIGQKEVIDELSLTIKRGRAGLSGHKRPLGSFVFLGPSGVGKTETAKVLAHQIFGSVDNLIRFDMSEFGESFNTSKLIGAPAGYVGYNEGGRLTESVRRRPYSVILFDEIEKAHPDVFNLLLQILEDGHLTDGAGKKVNFKNTIIIMTSNIGLESFDEQATLGFEVETGQKKLTKDNLDNNYQAAKEDATQTLKQVFRPELFNRIDKVLVFKPLDKKAISQIVNLALLELKETLSAQKLNLKWDKRVLEFLTTASFSADQGARMIRKTIQQQIEDPLADKILLGEFKPNSTVKIGVQDKKIVLSK